MCFILYTNLGVNEQCQRVILMAKNTFEKIPVATDELHGELDKLHKLIGALPVNSDVDKVC